MTRTNRKYVGSALCADKALEVLPGMIVQLVLFSPSECVWQNIIQQTPTVAGVLANLTGLCDRFTYLWTDFVTIAEDVVIKLTGWKREPSLKLGVAQPTSTEYSCNRTVMNATRGLESQNGTPTYSWCGPMTRWSLVHPAHSGLI